MSITDTTILEKLNNRYATKKFDSSKKISKADFSTLLEVLRLSPSSFGLQPWKFIVVENPKIRAKLKEVSWNQSQIVDASHMVVICHRKGINKNYVEEVIQSIAKTRGLDVSVLEEYKNMILGFISNPNINLDDWTKRQSYIALGMLLSAAANLDIDSCPMEGFDIPAYNQILGLEEKSYLASVVCTLGYRATDDHHAGLKKVRYSQEHVIETI